MILETVVYLCIGLIMMMLGYWVIDLFIPVDFPQEIREGNKSVGWVSAGIYAGLGFVIRSAIISISTGGTSAGGDRYSGFFRDRNLCLCDCLLPR